MPTTYRATLTEVGAALVADAIASGTTLTWAKMALGDGNGSAVIVDPSRTSLVNEQYRAPLNDLGRDSANPNTIVGTLVVPPETGGWTIREFGIYDNAATPRLVAYGETPEIEKPASSAGTGINLRLRFKLVVSAEANITLAPDSNEAYATIEYVKDNAVKSLSVSGRTITYTMGDGDTHTIKTQDTTYDDATQSAHGLMSAKDKKNLDDVPSTYLKKAGDTVTGEITSSYGAANTSGAVNHFSGTMAVNDGWAIRAGANASNDGYLEIATRDDGSEPIYVRQYTGAFATLKRSATLLDGSGNTAFPGTVIVGGLKISDSTIGSATKPVYVKAGTITAGTYELKKTVPADAVFTDTVFNGGSINGTSITRNSNASWLWFSGGINWDLSNGARLVLYGAQYDIDSALQGQFRLSAGNSSGSCELIGRANGSLLWGGQNVIYTHPTTAGNKHIPAGGSSGQILKWSTAGTAVWDSPSNSGAAPKPTTSSGVGQVVNWGGDYSDALSSYTLPSGGTWLCITNSRSKSNDPGGICWLGLRAGGTKITPWANCYTQGIAWRIA